MLSSSLDRHTEEFLTPPSKPMEHPLGDQPPVLQGNKSIPEDASASIENKPIIDRRIGYYKTQKSPEYKHINCLCFGRGGKEAFYINTVDFNLPAASFIFRLLSDFRLSELTNIICTSLSDKLEKPYFLHQLDGTVEQLLNGRENMNLKFLYRSGGNDIVVLFNELLGEDGQKLLKKFDGYLYMEKLKDALLTLYRKFTRGNINDDDILSYSRISMVISEGFNRLKKDMDDNKMLISSPFNSLKCDMDTGNIIRSATDVECRILDALHKARKCFEYILGPNHLAVFPFMQSVRSRLIESRVSAKPDGETEQKITLVFSENKKLTAGAEALTARSDFVKSGMEFYATGSQKTEVLAFDDIGTGASACALETYLTEGKISKVNQLNVKDTCTLMVYANKFQIREIENQCLFNILNCIRTGCFSDRELQEIVSITPYSPELNS